MQNSDKKLVPYLVLTATIMLVAMTTYEALKQFIFPEISIWESHIITIVFSTIIATSSGYLILKRLLSLNNELNRKNIESERLRRELEDKIEQLNIALSEIKTLSGMLPICSSCKKIRDDKGYWTQIESYIREHSQIDFSHSLCPDCALELYPEYDLRRKKDI